MKKLSQGDRLCFAYAAFAGKDLGYPGVGNGQIHRFLVVLFHHKFKHLGWCVVFERVPSQFVFMDESGECSQQGALGGGALISFQHESFDLLQPGTKIVNNHS